MAPLVEVIQKLISDLKDVLKTESLAEVDREVIENTMFNLALTVRVLKYVED